MRDLEGRRRGRREVNQSRSAPLTPERALTLRENSSELLKEFQSARKTGNSRSEMHELVSLRRVYA